MSLKICSFENMISDAGGTDLARAWFPRIVAESFLGSTKDGSIKRSPDPVTMIDGDLTWFNSSDAAQHITVQVIRAPRSVVVQNPSTVLIHDAWSFQVGRSPAADFPSVIQDTFGGRMQIDRPEVTADTILYGRVFYDADATQTFVDVGEVQPKDSLHFRYLAAVQTPGVWTTPTEFDPRWEASARWARLLAFATPVGSR